MNPRRDVMRYCRRHKKRSDGKRSSLWHGKFVDVLVWRPDAESAERWLELSEQRPLYSEGR